MSANIKTFIAIPVEPPLLLLEVLDQLASLDCVRPVRRENMHITLKFLGGTRVGLVDQISERLQRCSAEVSRASIRLVGLNAFPNAERPAVVWATPTPADLLEQLANTLGPSLAELGFAVEQRPYVPHLTLGRIGDASDQYCVGDVLSDHAETDFGSVELDRVVFFESTASSADSVYTALSSHELASSAEEA